MKNYSTVLLGALGENLVVSELARRGIVSTTFSGNVPDIDILAFKNNVSIPIQVKSLSTKNNPKGNISTNANNYLKIVWDDKKQIISGLKPIDKNLIFIFTQIGENYGNDKFFICKQNEIQKIIFNGYKEYLDKNNGIRPRNPQSTHCSYNLSQLLKFEDNWELIESKFK